jgi:hypothetical protein
MLVELLVLTMLGVFSDCLFGPCTFGDEKKSEPIQQEQNGNQHNNHTRVVQKQ